MTAPGDGPRSLRDLLEAMRPRDGDTEVSVADVLGRIGDRSFAAAILVPALLLVSPLSGIPGTPTVGAAIVLTIAGQAIAGRSHLWLPGVLMRRSVAAPRMIHALRFLERPVAWVDVHSHGRLRPLMRPPLHRLSYLAMIAVALTWPVLELLPFVTTIGALSVALMSAALITRDGAYMVAGYLVGGGLLFAAASLFAGLF